MPALDKDEILRVSEPYGGPNFHYDEEANPTFQTVETLKVHLLTEPDHAHHEERDWIYRAYQILMATWTNHEISPADLDTMVKVLKHEYSKGVATIPLEAFHMTFAIENVPRSVTHQIVRHRRMGFGQESLRVTDVRQHGFRLPKSIDANRDARAMFIGEVHRQFNTYAKLVDMGIPHEDARLIMGMGLLTYIVITTDLRTFIDYMFARTQGGALEEHQLVAVKMFEEFKKTYPLIYEILNNKFPKDARLQ